MITLAPYKGLGPVGELVLLAGILKLHISLSLSLPPLSLSIEVIFLSQPTSQYVVVGRTFSLPCQAQAVNSDGSTELLNIIFYKNNVLIPVYPPGDYHYSFDSVTTGLISPETSITDDGATFQCKLLTNDSITTPPITITVAGEFLVLCYTVTKLR